MGRLGGADALAFDGLVGGVDGGDLLLGMCEIARSTGRHHRIRMIDAYKTPPRPFDIL
ncbi:MAG: hypothetical protein K0Q70_1433, partial [Rhodospirillales bacterium]|nr:hypothetical protein [Rhodospirillales bacterium]